MVFLVAQLGFDQRQVPVGAALHAQLEADREDGGLAAAERG